ncbi:MAG: methylmalonyl-CoA mutase family protein, partial [Flavobacteriales bacterium]
MKEAKPYHPRNNIRIATAASLFDGHDAAINIMRRILQSSGAEVIHLGHDRSVQEVVDCAIQEDVQAIAITSYQGGHMEYFKYMCDLLKEQGGEHIKIFGGGGGTILPDEINELHKYGISRLYHADDGREMGLQGMINDALKKSDFPLGGDVRFDGSAMAQKNPHLIARLVSAAENYPKKSAKFLNKIRAVAAEKSTPVVGITGTGGSGKSSLIDELVRRFLGDFKNKTIGIVSVDPSKRKTGGALLGDRIRMNAIFDSRCFMRSLATRQSNLALSPFVQDAVDILKAAGYNLIILETSGIGQSDTEIIDHCDVSMYVMTPEYGAATQLEKIDMLDFADLVVINKFDKKGADDALRDVSKQYARNRKIFETEPSGLHVFGTVAAQFNDPGVNVLYEALIKTINDNLSCGFKSSFKRHDEKEERTFIVPKSRTRYLSEIADEVRNYHKWAELQSEVATALYNFKGTIARLQKDRDGKGAETVNFLKSKYKELQKDLEVRSGDILSSWDSKIARYKKGEYVYEVRGKEISVKTHEESLSHTKIPKISLPAYKDWGSILKWNLLENVPGEFPFTAGVFPFKRQGEDPTRMFAGEGAPERTNKRFHYLSHGMPAKRLSTAFDSVTLYGKDPDIRPDIYGKIGNSGVSVCCLDDAKKLYSGFDLCDPKTSVSMTINGPAPIMLAFFLNAAIDQQCELYIKKNGLLNKVKKKISDHFRNAGISRPAYNGKLPEGN